MTAEPTHNVALADSDIEMLMAAIEFQLENDANMTAEARNNLDYLFQHLDRAPGKPVE
jgi:hypothetical protein